MHLIQHLEPNKASDAFSTNFFLGSRVHSTERREVAFVEASAVVGNRETFHISSFSTVEFDQNFTLTEIILTKSVFDGMNGIHHRFKEREK